MHSFIHTQQHPPSPSPYVVQYNSVHQNHHHVNHPSISLQASIPTFASPPTLQQLSQAQAVARQGQPSPAPAANGVNASIVPSPLWQQQLLKADLCRKASPPHHRARQSALASKGMGRAAVLITNPNAVQTPPNENGHLREQSVSSVTDPSGKPDSGPADSDHPSSTSAPALPSRPVAQKKPDANWTTLDMGGMQLKNLAKGLFNFTFLTTLYLNHNHLLTLPQDISRLRHLIHLDLSGNQLTTLQPAIGMLVSLRELLLFDNRLSTLPAELGNLHQLELLGIEGNPIESKLRTIAQQEGTAGLIAYLRDTSEPPAEPEPRQWQAIISDQEKRIQANDPSVIPVSLLCYNILCNKYATTQAYGYTPSWALEWSYRKQKILNEIKAQDCDIICLEELDQISYEEFFVPELHALGYDSCHFVKGRAKTMSEEKKREVDGCATFYKVDKFILVEQQVVDYRAIAMQRPDFQKSDDMFTRVLRRDNIAAVLSLEERKTGARLVVCNVHIFWDPEYRDVKLVQVSILVEELGRIADQLAKLPPRKSVDGSKFASYKDGTKIPVLVCGDFNSLPDSTVNQLLSEGYIEPEHPDFTGREYGEFTSKGIRHPFKFKSAYASIGELPFTNFTTGFQGVLDYIWYSGETAHVTDVLGEIDEAYLSRQVGFPNAHFPSDHILLSAKLLLKPPKEQAQRSGPPGLKHPGF